MLINLTEYLIEIQNGQATVRVRGQAVANACYVVYDGSSHEGRRSSVEVDNVGVLVTDVPHASFVCMLPIICVQNWPTGTDDYIVDLPAAWAALVLGLRTQGRIFTVELEDLETGPPPRKVATQLRWWAELSA